MNKLSYKQALLDVLNSQLIHNPGGKHYTILDIRVVEAHTIRIN